MQLTTLNFILILCLCCQTQNRGPLKNFWNVYCVLANQNKVHDMQANHKPINVAVCGLVISPLIGLFLATQ